MNKKWVEGIKGWPELHLPLGRDYNAVLPTGHGPTETMNSNESVVHLAINFLIYINDILAFKIKKKEL